MGSGTARGGHLSCKEENRWVRFPLSPPIGALTWIYGFNYHWQTISDLSMSVRYVALWQTLLYQIRRQSKTELIAASSKRSRTPPFQGGNTSSNLVAVTIEKIDV